MSPLLLGAGRNVSKSWNPTDLSALEVWWDASQLISLAEGGDITTFVDVGGKGRNPVQTNASFKPIFRDSVQHGLSVARFVASQDRFQGQDWEVHSNTNGLTVWAVLSATGGTADVIVSKYDAGGGQRQWILGTDAWNIQDNIGAFSATTIATYSGDLDGDGWTSVVGLWLPGAAPYARINGVLDATAAASVTDIGDGSADIWFGSLPSTGGFGGDIGEIGMVSAELTGADLANLESYLANKWGI